MGEAVQEGLVRLGALQRHATALEDHMQRQLAFQVGDGSLAGLQAWERPGPATCLSRPTRTVPGSVRGPRAVHMQTPVFRGSPINRQLRLSRTATGPLGCLLLSRRTTCLSGRDGCWRLWMTRRRGSGGSRKRRRRRGARRSTRRGSWRRGRRDTSSCRWGGLRWAAGRGGCLRGTKRSEVLCVRAVGACVLVLYVVPG